MTDTDAIAARLREYDLLDEREALIHDVERHIAIASEEASRAEALEAEVARLRAERQRMVCAACGTVSRDDTCDCTKMGLDCRRARPHDEALLEMVNEAEAELARLRAPVEGEVGEAVGSLQAWAPLVASGYEVPAASKAMSAAADLITRQAAEIEIGLRAEAMLRDDLRRTEDARIATEASLRDVVEVLRAWLKADDIGIGVDIKTAREAARAFLAKMEKPND